MGLRLAALMPHFPSQTHTFYWREICALRELGAEVHCISTTHPPAGEVVHPWAHEARGQTCYLTPISPASLLRGFIRVLAAGPSAWGRSARRTLGADDAGIQSRVRLSALVPVAGHLARVCRDEGIEHLHAHSLGDVAMLAMLCHELGGPPYSVTLHGPLEHYGPAQRAKWRHAAFGICVSRRLRQEVLEAIPELDPSRIEVVSMGVDTRVFRRSAPYAPPARGEPWHLVTCGRLHPAKGHDDCIRALRLLRDRNIDARLCILGDGPARDDLESLVESLGLASVVTLAGAVSEERVRDELARAHAFCLGSHDEAIGVATMEAMSMGLPVIVTRVGGVPELVEHEKSGLLVPPRDPSAMADAVERVLRDADLAQRISDAARLRIERDFDARRSAEVIARRLGIPSKDAPVRTEASIEAGAA